jgi:NhaP-type Na+/H+ or K+/H+ antiporter
MEKLNYFIRRVILLIFLIGLFNNSFASTTIENNTNTHIQVEKEHEVEHQSNHTDTSPLFFIIIAVIIGALTRYGLQKSTLPFTVALLLIGFALGALGRVNYLDIYEIGNIKLNLQFLDKSIEWAANIDPHLLLYVFLPILIFEAAFAMDVHVFKKTFVNATIMAVPGIIVAIVLSAAFVVGLNYFGIGLGKWNWTIALLFGSVISATDPVAVVSILKTLGASKKLGTLIEGESLLNDGTAIVIFMVIYLGLTGSGIEGSPIVEFFRVSFGGIAIGLIIGWLIIKWIKKVFNDMLVEITAIIAAAYLTFFIAEHFLHVSGVLALVAFGLVMASYGRTKISPEVQHFLHEFWELAAFIANTLIFLIVGVVIAERTVFTLNDFIVLGLLYIGIFIIRAIVIALFFPLMKKFGYGITKDNAYVLWYGALRGAIGLALALIIAGSESIDKEIRDQFLFLTAGIVTLTLLINATTIKILVDALGLTKVPPAKALSIQNTKNYIQQSAENNIERLKTDRYLKRANWGAVREYLPEYSSDNVIINQLDDTIIEYRRRILEKEKSSYWHQFKDGMLGDEAYHLLTNDINDILDIEGNIPLSQRNDLEELLTTSSFLSKAQNYPIIGKTAKRLFFVKLTTSYDCAKGFVAAQEDNLKLLEGMFRAADKKENKTLQIIEEEINENKIEGLTFLRNLGKEYPEIYNAIATREATRTMLNYEKHTVERLVKKGRVTKDEANKLITQIENKMKQLRDAPPVFELPNAQDLLAEVKWLEDIDHKTFNHISKLFTSKVFNTGKILLTEGKKEDGMFIIARGTVNISINNELIDSLGPGTTIGEVAALNNTVRAATVTAETPVTVLWISSNQLKNLINDYKVVGDKIWDVTAHQYAAYYLKNVDEFNGLSQSQLRKKLKKGKLISLDEKELFNLSDKIGVLIDGKVIENNIEIASPILLKDKTYSFTKGSKIFVIEV